jgi:2-polyprenyl-6-methoxyphenol hydroxylase-like FAD-dependent oxidoreductase
VDRARDGAGTYTAPVVVGADGSGSLVRRRLLDREGAHEEIARAVMADIPVGRDGCSWDGHARARYDFDFRAVPRGLAGTRGRFPA